MRKVAILFPGQGSQKIGMCAEYMDCPSFEQYFAQARTLLGYDLKEIILSGPIEQLNTTAITQPALLTCSVALWERALAQGRIDPSTVFAMAGHSLGEYSALVCAGVLSFSEGLLLVAERGRLMQEAVPLGQGAMLALLGVNAEQAAELCARFNAQDRPNASAQGVVCANINTPTQVVVAGWREEISLFETFVKEQGVRRAVLLAVSVPSHCALMQSAADALTGMLETLCFRAPRVPVMVNVSATLLSDPLLLKQALIEQLTQAVLWAPSIQALADQGCVEMIECGPGTVLQSLNKAINPQILTENIIQ